MISGILPINKPSGITSFDVIRIIKKKIGKNYKNLKIGHGGTLDPLASGVLLILFGNATKIFNFLLDSDKIYNVCIKFGAFTDTDDITGKIIQEFNNEISLGQIKEKLLLFKGKIYQTPPNYSAVKVNGIRSYDLARNKKFEVLKPKEVKIKEIIINSYDNFNKELNLTIKCSSGTYIRSIARDLGKLLNCGGYIKRLTRLYSSGVSIDKCYDLTILDENNIEKYLIDINNILSFLPSLTLILDNSYILNGKKLYDNFFVEKPIFNGKYRIIKDNKLLAIVEKKNLSYKYLRVFSNE